MFGFLWYLTEIQTLIAYNKKCVTKLVNASLVFEIGASKCHFSIMALALKEIGWNLNMG